MKKLLCLLLIAGTLSISSTHAQDLPSKLKQAKWVRIMTDDSTYNYLEAEAEFQKFYAAFQKEKIKEAKKRERSKSSAAEEHLETPMDLLVADYLKWCAKMQAFVLADGRIMPLAQRLAIINEVRNTKIAD